MAKELKGSLTTRKTSSYWYGKYQYRGKVRVVNLQVKIGEDRDESALEARQKLNTHLESLRNTVNREDAAQAVYKSRYNNKVRIYRIEELPDLWKNAERKRPVGERRIKQNTAWLNAFIEWCSKEHPSVVDVDFVSHDIAKEYMALQWARGISEATYNDIAAVLKLAFRQAKSTAFDEIVEKETKTISRKPFTPEELRAILDAAQTDPLIRPLIVVAASSPLRKGDICMLKWVDDEENSQINFDNGMLSVTTSKTGAKVSIPMNDLLYSELQRQVGNGSEFVFPRQAKQYRENPKVLTDRLKRILALAGFYDESTPPHLPPPIDAFDADDLKAKANDFISTTEQPVSAPEKREKMRVLFDAYIGGSSIGAAAKAAKVSKSSASKYLNEIQQGTGVRFIRGTNTRKKTTVDIRPVCRGSTTIHRKNGKRRASIRDWHGFRTTWITSQLCAGMSVQLISKASGHASARAIESNYFKPNEQQLKEAFARYLPEIVTTSHGSPTSRAIELLSGATPSMSKNELYGRIRETLQVIKDG